MKLAAPSTTACYLSLAIALLNLTALSKAWQSSRNTVGWAMMFNSRTKYYASSTNLLGKLRMTVESNAGTALIQPKIPKSVWRWPAKWPFQEDSFYTVESNKTVELSIKAVTVLKEHLNIFMGENSNILEISASPMFVQSSERKVTQLGMDTSLSKANAVLPYQDEAFDRVVVTSGIEGVENPLDFYREIWRVLKPNGKVITAFSSVKISSTLPVKIWTTTTDDQKIWIAGSYHQYSAGSGFMDIEAYDLFNTTKGTDPNSVIAVSDDMVYTVHARKTECPDIKVDPFNHVQLKIAGYRFMNNNDKYYTALRTNSTLQKSQSDAEVNHVMENLPNYQSVYSVLKDVKDFVFPASIKAMLASFVVDGWTNSAEQVFALKSAVGLLPPNEFWGKVGNCTNLLAPRDKINLLARLITYIGSKSQVPGLLDALPDVLVEVKDLFVLKNPEMTEADAQLLASEFITCDYLLSSQSAEKIKTKIIRYIGSSPSVMKTLLGTLENLKKRWELPSSVAEPAPSTMTIETPSTINSTEISTSS